MSKTISKKGIILFKRMMGFALSTFLEIKGNAHIQFYERYFNLEKKNDNYIFSEKDALIPWLREWAEIELEEKEEMLHHVTEDGEILHSYPHPKYQKARRRFLSSFPELYCLVIHQTPIHNLVLEAANYSDFFSYNDRENYNNHAFFKLIEIDKSFLSANWAIPIIRNAEYYSDHKFFKRLSISLKVKGFRSNLKAVEFGLATILLWNLGGRRLSYSNFLDELNKLDYNYYQESPEAFRKFVNRLGLTKYRKVGRKQ